MYFHFVWYLLQPYFLLLLVTAIAVANLWRRRRETRKRLLLVSLPLLGFVLLSMPAVAYLTQGSLEWPYPPLKNRPTDTDAIIVMSAGIYPSDNVRAKAELDRDSCYRCLHASELYHQGIPCPIIVCGGNPDEGDENPPNARVMQDFLQEIGVPSAYIIVEDRSRTTYENVLECSKLVEKHQFKKILLVTDGIHLHRALGCFRKQGIDAIPAGCNYRATKFSGTIISFWPDSDSIESTGRVAHEWLGLGWYWLRGRI
jgi:uncharacterized SAM-binding protein YcdF (DUF218 family)